MPSGLPFLNQAYDVAPLAFAARATAPPLQMITLPEGVIVGAAGVEIGTALLPGFEHVPFATVMPRNAFPDAPTLNVMAFVPWPAVMAPLLIGQAQVAPAVRARD